MRNGVAMCSILAGRMADTSPTIPSVGAVQCAVCQTVLPADATFCLRCGTRVVRPAPTPVAAPAVHPTPLALPVMAPARHGTLVGVAAPVVPVTAPVESAPAPQPPPSHGATATSPDGSPQEPVRRVINAQATMLGVVSPGASPMTPAPAPAAPAGFASREPTTPAVTPAIPRSGTMHGVAPAQPATVPTMPAQTDAPTQPATVPSQPAVSGQTAVGYASASAIATGRHRKDVMLDARPGDAPRISHQGSGASYDSEFPVVPKKGGRTGLVVGVLVALVALGGGVAWWATHRSASNALAATLSTSPTGEQRVTLALPDAANGRVRYNGAEFPIDAQGHVEFAIALPASRVGVVEVPVTVVTASGASSTRTMRFLVAWRAETDLRKLADDPPRIHIVFHVVRGSSLSIAGQAIRVSGETGIAELPAPAPAPLSEGEVRRERYAVRVVTPDGAAIEEQYELAVPRTALRVDAPLPVSLTSESQVIVRGTAPNASRVTVGTHAATVTNGTFNAVVPLNDGSNSLDVTAWSTTGAPTRAGVTVYRNVTVEQFLVSGGGDRGAAALATRPVVDGVRLRVRGTVVGAVIEPSPGLRACQIVVNDRACPAGRCTAWVDLPADVNVTANAAVDVVGELRGSRAYTTGSGERRTDAVILGVSVTPAGRR